MTESHAAALRREFEAGEGSFLLALRGDLHWSRQGFLRLVGAMQAYVEANPERETLERWIAEGFWYVGWFVREWSSHPNFPQDYEAGYYQRAYQRLFDLAFWLFSGNCPNASGTLPPFGAD